MKVINFQHRKNLKDRRAAAQKMEDDRRISINRLLNQAKKLVWRNKDDQVKG